MIRFCSKVSRYRLLVLATAATTALSATARAGSDVAVELPDPFFTEKAAVQKEVELSLGFDKKATEKEYEIGAGASWVFFDRLQFGVEVPFGIRNPDTGPTERNIGDVEFSTKYQFLDVGENGFDLSLAGSIAAPTGSRTEEIGGTGEWGVSLLGGTLIDTGETLPDLAIHLQFGYQQQIRLSNEQKETAETLGSDRIREKELVWGVALNAPLLDGRFVPNFEVIGRNILDAVDPNEEGTIVELGGGFWVSPIPEMEGFAIGLAGKAPVTNRKESDYSLMFVAKYEFE